MITERLAAMLVARATDRASTGAGGPPGVVVPRRG